MSSVARATIICLAFIRKIYEADSYTCNIERVGNTAG